MQTRHRNTFTTIHSEGALLPPDLLARISEGDSSLEGLKLSDYHLLKNEKLNEAINRSWNRLIGAWKNFKEARHKLLVGQPGTTETRERWLLPLFQELGYGRLQTSAAFEIEGKSYPISHLWGSAPIHLLGCNIELDKRTPGIAGAARRSPHSMLQEFLNRSEDHLWAILSNGLRLRLLRDNVSLTRQSFLEFDLESMMEGEVYSDFVLLWMICHQSRFEQKMASGELRVASGEKPLPTRHSTLTDIWLEKWTHAAHEQGTRALDQLREGVEEAINQLGSGFLGHPSNQAMRAKLRSGSLSTQDYYRQLLRLVYSLIFLFVAEDRDLLFPPNSDEIAQQRYTDYYSTQRLRHLAERSRGSRHADLWQGLLVVINLLNGKGMANGERGMVSGERGMVRGDALALPVLGSFLFSEQSAPDLDSAQLANTNLLTAIRALAYTVDQRTLRPVDYKNLGPEELGSVYESLLELHPEINIDAGTFNLTTAGGHERKTTGSYYTPSSLIQVLLDSALDPVVEDRLKDKKKQDEAEKALLSLTVCDPACGSGHFLIAAAHRIARKLAGVRTGDDEPSPESTRAALRDVISHCLYGVDLNPMAVELCKVSLWMEALEPGKPLSFLDAHIKCGNSLVGVGPGLEIEEIPDKAFQPAFGDDRATATALRRRNKREREGQLGFRWDVTLIEDQEDLAQWVAHQSQKLESMPEDEATQIQSKEKAYKTLLTTNHYQRQRLEFDLWTAAFFWPIPKGDAESMLAPTQQELMRLRKGEDLDSILSRRVQATAEQHRFFHWGFEFPTVFSEYHQGFDIVLSNPPWELLQPEEVKFFFDRDTEIANLPGSQRKLAIEKLHFNNIVLFEEWQDYQRLFASVAIFVRNSERFPFQTGKLNSYAIFAELFYTLVSSKGRSGVILPTGIATDFSNKNFFDSLVKSGRLISLFDFTNVQNLFPAVDSNMRFCLLTIGGEQTNVTESEFIFFASQVSHIRDERKRYNLSKEDIARINPNTLTCPLFRSKQDAEMIRKIYQQVPIMINEESGDNPWRIIFRQGLFNMTSDSRLFAMRKQLEEGGFALSGNRFIKDDQVYLPLYEAKMIHIFDHRFAHAGAPKHGERIRGTSIYITEEEHQSADYLALSRYWVNQNEVYKRLSLVRYWFLGFRDITGTVTNVRTSIFSILPWSGVGNKIPIWIFEEPFATLQSCLLANMCSLTLDYIVRQKLGGTSMNFFYVKQFPVLPPKAYTLPNIKFIIPLVIELVYTAWDLQPFAADIGYCGPPLRWDEERRSILRAELDAYYAYLYDLNRKQLRYILDPADLTEAELEDILDPWEEVADPLEPDGYAARADASTFPGETFRVLKDKEIRKYGEYRTRRLVLEAWQRLAAVDFDVEAYVPMVDPPPAHPSLAHPNKDGSVYEGSGLVLDFKDVENGEWGVANGEEGNGELRVANGEDVTEETDYGLYKCQLCGQMVMGFDREEHAKDVHGGQEVGFVKL
jgi:hypothetical protein